MTIVYKTSKDIPFEKLDALTGSVGWDSRGKEAWDKILQSSSFFITAWEQENLIGMGRILEDGTMCMVYDIIVHPDYQGKKVGSTIMHQIKDVVEQSDFQSIGLFAWDKNPINICFYEKFGFKQVNFGMKLKL